MPHAISTSRYALLPGTHAAPPPHSPSLKGALRRHLWNAHPRQNDIRYRRKLTPCRCSQEMVKTERDKLVVLHDIQWELIEANKLARQSLDPKRTELELAEPQHALAEVFLKKNLFSNSACV